MPPRLKTITVNLPTFRGGSLELLRNHEHEAILCGPSDTSKTWAGCTKAFMLCNDRHRPGVNGIMVRKLFNSIHDSSARTFNTITNGMPVKRYGGEKFTEKWVFPNGSQLVCCGMDNPGKLLSSEWDFALTVQTEQLSLDEFEQVGRTVTGRGAKVAYPQVFGDCNPAGASHWLRTRKQCRLIRSVHKDNPALYDDAGNITPAGVTRLAILDSTLSGVRRKRLLDGLWASAEGAVYDEFDSNCDLRAAGTNVCVREHREMKRWFIAGDEGYDNPAVLLLVGEDGDGRWHCFAEFYRREVIPALVVQQAKLWFNDPVGNMRLQVSGIPQSQVNALTLAQPGAQDAVVALRCDVCAMDESAAGLIADMNAVGVYTKGAKGRVFDGIGLIQSKIRRRGDGTRGYTIDPSCVNHINEFESYCWKPDSPKDQPVKKDDHSMDAIRYLADHLHVGTGAFQSVGDIRAPVAAGERFIMDRITADRIRI